MFLAVLCRYSSLVQDSSPVLVGSVSPNDSTCVGRPWTLSNVVLVRTLRRVRASSPVPDDFVYAISSGSVTRHAFSGSRPSPRTRLASSVASGTVRLRVSQSPSASAALE